AVQGRKISDRHSHETIEQVYYILKGTPTVYLDETKYTVREGDIVYIPPMCVHHLLNDKNDDWVELLIISAPVTRKESLPIVRNWRDQAPEVSHNAAVVWELLSSVDDDEASSDRRRLLRMNYITRQAIQQGQASDEHSHADQEQIYYILGGNGSVLLGEEMFRVREGHVIYTPKDVPHKLINDGTEDWIEYLIVSAKLQL
ncbi:MAG: cupin domain-containing protein, partial [Candidatus Latescibacteria bacterium]|nr:cupin domain-containing protein [Candidatus Latescibacterota bacterium]